MKPNFKRVLGLALLGCVISLASCRNVYVYETYDRPHHGHGVTSGGSVTPASAEPVNFQ